MIKLSHDETRLARGLQWLMIHRNSLKPLDSLRSLTIIKSSWLTSHDTTSGGNHTSGHQRRSLVSSHIMKLKLDATPILSRRTARPKIYLKKKEEKKKKELERLCLARAKAHFNFFWYFDQPRNLSDYSQTWDLILVGIWDLMWPLSLKARVLMRWWSHNPLFFHTFFVHMGFWYVGRFWPLPIFYIQSALVIEVIFWDSLMLRRVKNAL